MKDYPDKKKILDIRLSHPEGDTPDTLRVVEQARIGMGLSEYQATVTDDEPQDTPLVPLNRIADAETQPDEPMPYSEAPPENRSFIRRVAMSLGGMLPKKGDSPPEIIRKCIFFIALITLIVSLSYIINDMIIIPVKNQSMYDDVASLYDPDNPVPPPPGFKDYPEGILDSFKALYARNQDIRGWMKYTDSNGKWLNISYPVMFSGDNEYYLNHDFQKEKNKNGALFFDKRTKLESPDDTNRVLIVYGHNMASGQMLSPLNKFLNNLNYMRSAPLISLDTLYKRNEYVVFSVMLLSTRSEHGPYFDYLRTSFNSDEEYLDFISNIRDRSIYDFNSVDVTAGDELLILSTCTSPSTAHFKDGRCVVVARRVRDNETVAVRGSDIVKNKDVIMPYVWYINQKLTPHAFYTDSGHIISGTSTTYRPGTNPGTYPTYYIPTQTDGTNTGGGTTGSGTTTGTGSGTATDTTEDTATGDKTSTTKDGTDGGTTSTQSTTTGPDETTSTDSTEPSETTEPEPTEPTEPSDQE